MQEYMFHVDFELYIHFTDKWIKKTAMCNSVSQSEGSQQCKKKQAKSIRCISQLNNIQEVKENTDKQLIKNIQNLQLAANS